MGWQEVPENQNPFYTKTASLKGMNPDFMGAFAQMAQDYYAQTGKAIKVDDAFRSHEAQANAYRRKPNLAAPPGRSLHEQGMAMDIDTGEANELAQRGLLQRYGFYRPMLGQGRSGKNEPWHIQYAGMRRQKQAQQPTGGKWVEVPEEEPGIWGSAKEALKQSVGELAGTYGSLLGQREGESREDAYKRIAGATAQGLGATGQQPPDTWRGTVGSVLGSLPVPLAELGAMNMLLPGGGGIVGSMLRGGATFGAQQGLRPGGSVPRGVAEGLAFGSIPPGAGRLARGLMGGAIGAGSTYMQPGDKTTKDYLVGGGVPAILAMMGGKGRTPESPAPEPVPEMTPELSGRNPFLALPGGVTPRLALPAPPEGTVGPEGGFVLREAPPETKLRKTPWRGGYQAVEEKIDAGLRVPPERDAAKPSEAAVEPTPINKRLNELRKADVENRLIIDRKTGEVLSDTKGTATEADLDMGRWSEMLDREHLADIHNHPEGSGPSENDWARLGWPNIREVRIATKAGDYVLEKPDTITPDKRWKNPKEIKESFYKIENEIFDSERSKQMTANQIVDEIGDRLSKELGIKFTKPIPEPSKVIPAKAEPTPTPAKEPWEMTAAEHKAEGQRLYKELGSEGFVNSDFRAQSEDKLARVVPAESQDAKNLANYNYNRTKRNIEGSYFAQNEAGEIVRVDGKDPKDVAFYEGKGFKPLQQPKEPGAGKGDVQLTGFEPQLESLGKRLKEAAQRDSNWLSQYNDQLKVLTDLDNYKISLKEAIKQFGPGPGRYPYRSKTQLIKAFEETKKNYHEARSEYNSISDKIENIKRKIAERQGETKLYSGGPSTADIKAGVKKVKEWWGEREPLTVSGHTWGNVKYSIGKYFGVTKTPEGTKAKRDVTRMAGRWQTDKLQAEALFGDAESRYSNLDRQGFAKLVSPIQRGGKSPDPAFQKLYDLYHEMGDSLWQKINQYKPLAYLDHYFRQSWTNADDPAIQENIKNYFAGRPFINYLLQDAQGKPQMETRPYGGRTLTGGRSYFKHRVIPDVETGMMLGLQPREMNPIRHMLNDIAEKSHFVRGMELWGSYFKNKTIKYYRPGSQPAGWQPINDPMGKVSIPYLQKVLESRAQKTQAPGVSTKTGKPVEPNVLEWQAYAPEEVARTFNNWLGKGFRGEPWYDAYRGIVDPLRKIGVALTTFHLKMTLNTDMAMRGGQHMSKAIGHLLTGDPINAAKEAKMLGRTWSGEQFIRGQYLGKGLLSELLSPGTHPELREVAMDMRDSGLLPTSAKSLQPWIQASKGALKEAAQEGYGSLKNLASGKPLKAVQSAWRGFDKFLDATAAPIMEYGVPRAKAAAFAFLRKGWMEETGKKYGGVENIPPEIKAQGMYDLARHVDHMMGQINYDALHFNRKLRDLLFFAIKYPGWNIGSAAWMATGAKGIAKTLTGQERTTLDRTAMRTTLGLLASVGVTGLVTQYLLTGSFPDNPADIYTKGIKTGYKDDYGNDEYVRDATYLKDLQSVLHDPVRTFQSKSPDVLRVMGEIYNNSDYFGTDIWTPGAPITQKAKELGGYGFTNLALPYSMRNVAASQSPFAKFGSFGGYSPTPRWLKESPLETTLSDANKRRTFKQTRQQFESRQLEKDLVKKYRESKDPVALQQGLAEAQQAGKLTAKQAQQTFKNAPVPPDIMRFWKSPVDVALTAFERGTPEEKRKYGRLLEEKLNRAVKGRPEWIQENKERIKNVLREIPQ